MLRAGLISRPKHATYQLTDRGLEVMESNPTAISVATLGQFQEFVDFHQAGKPSSESTPTTGASPELQIENPQTPEEQIENAYSELRAALIAEILERVLDKPPDFFEKLVLNVLQAMGYGGRVGSPVHHLGQSGDEGVDGVIREDELGLDLIYIQAKRWTNPVGRPEIQKFFGALHGKHASKGVFITTSSFSSDAIAYAESVSPRIVLVDGNTLARLMIDHGVGTTLADSFVLKRIDLDYFANEEDEVPAPPSAATIKS